MSVVFFFFFFQAEDGIRDDLVTGVQTCALPISVASASFWAAHAEATALDGAIVLSVGTLVTLVGETRSEERRVGKECRSQWAPGQYKKRTMNLHRQGS